MQKICVMNRLISSIFIVLLLVFGCGGGKRTVQSPDLSEGTTPRGLELLQEDFDPMQLVEPPLPIRPRQEEEPLPASGLDLPDSAGQDIPKEVIGYRIQIFQTEDATDARNFQKDALLRLDADVYLTYDNPYYKVRVGNFETRFEAEEYLATLESRGYRTAWIVRTRIENKDPVEKEIPENR